MNAIDENAFNGAELVRVRKARRRRPISGSLQTPFNGAELVRVRKEGSHCLKLSILRPFNGAELVRVRKVATTFSPWLPESSFNGAELVRVRKELPNKSQPALVSRLQRGRTRESSEGS